ncbi:MAG: 50S ribosomal protein L25 [Polyangiaceae bacterium]
MTTMQTLSAKPRLTAGKSENRRLRAAGSVPAVAYGKRLEAFSLSVAPKDVLNILRTEQGQNTVLKLNVEGKSEFLAMIKDYAYHPVTRDLTHVDFIEVKLDERITVEVPLVTTGKAVGVAKGGVLRQVFRKLPVSCVPDRIPLKIEADVTNLDLNHAVATKDLKLGEGVSVLLPAEQTIVSVVAPEKDRSEEAAAAPAAGAAAPAAGKDAKAAAPAAAAKDAKKK